VKPLDLPLGLKIAGHGQVVFRDVTRYGLHRLCVMQAGQYPDETVWVTLVRCCEVLAVRYTERIMAGVFTGFLWIYWKEG